MPSAFPRILYLSPSLPLAPSCAFPLCVPPPHSCLPLPPSPLSLSLAPLRLPPGISSHVPAKLDPVTSRHHVREHARLLDLAISWARKSVDQLSRECLSDSTVGKAAARLRGLTATACFTHIHAPSAEQHPVREGGGPGRGEACLVCLVSTAPVVSPSGVRCTNMIAVRFLNLTGDGEGEGGENREGERKRERERGTQRDAEKRGRVREPMISGSSKSAVGRRPWNANAAAAAAAAADCAYALLAASNRCRGASRTSCGWAPGTWTSYSNASRARGRKTTPCTCSPPATASRPSELSVGEDGGRA